MVKQNEMKTETIEFEGRVWNVRVGEGNSTFWARREMIDNLGLQCSRRVLQRRGHDYVWCPETGEALVSGRFLLEWFEMGRSADKKQKLEGAWLAFVEYQAKLQAVARVVDVGPTPVAPVEEPEPAEEYTTIDWQAFVYDDGAVRGVSLRAMVEAGLYEQMAHAVRALRASGFPSSPVRETLGSGQKGTDHILTLLDAQRFAARARTEVGAAILDTILEHHAEFQRVLEGDIEAQARVETHQRATGTDGGGVDYIAIMEAGLKQARQTREALQAAERERARLERSIEDVRQDIALSTHRRDGEMSTAAVARRCRIYSRSGKPHTTAVIALTRQWGFGPGLVRRVRLETAPGHSADYVEAHVFTVEGYERMRDQVAEFYGADGFDVETSTRTYRVTRRSQEVAR